ncbi:MAG: hypothetical protein EHM28_07935 [Spirochaetaceae bacterium]|nr:MAG: hypothetical protein EHM28_07935 [Spirochaetaceae bacterium]
MINKDDFFFNEKEKKWFFRAIKIGGIAAGAIVVLAIIILIVSSPQKAGSPDEDKKAEPVLAEKPGELKKPVPLYSFIIPEPENTVTDPSYRLSRVRLTRWDKILIDRFWADPAEIGLKSLSEKNRRAAEELLESIP